MRTKRFMVKIDISKNRPVLLLRPWGPSPSCRESWTEKRQSTWDTPLVDGSLLRRFCLLGQGQWNLMLCFCRSECMDASSSVSTETHHKDYDNVADTAGKFSLSNSTLHPEECVSELLDVNTTYLYQGWSVSASGVCDRAVDPLHTWASRRAPYPLQTHRETSHFQW